MYKTANSNLAVGITETIVPPIPFQLVQLTDIAQNALLQENISLTAVRTAMQQVQTENPA